MASFIETNFQVTEPAMVEILITFFGAPQPFDANITVEIDFASATSKQINDTLFNFLYYALTKSTLYLHNNIIVGEDFSGVPINLTVANGTTMQRINITIFDDNIVEDFEFINLRLSAENPDIIVVDQQNVATIDISDNDGMINYLTVQN